MKRFFQIIKKKKHKRFVIVLWAFLIAIELLCPLFCDVPAFAAGQNSPPSIVQNRSENKEFKIISDFQSTQDENFCNDECLCHGMAILGIGFITPEKKFFRSERIAFLTFNPYTNSLSPPHHPPKIA